jgi:hypothetical protein
MATATQWGHAKVLDIGKRSSASCHFENALRHKIVGREEAVQALADLSGLAPACTLPRTQSEIFVLGPTG